MATESWASTEPHSPTSAPMSLTGASDVQSEEGSNTAQQSGSASTCTSSGADSWTRDSTSTHSRSDSREATPTAVTSTEASSHSASEAATITAVGGESDFSPSNELRSGSVSSQWELSTADNTLTGSEAATPSVAASVSPSDGVHADISSTPVAVPVSLAAPATAASAAGARPRQASAREHCGPHPAWSLPTAPPAETVGSCPAASEMSASHSPPLTGVACGPAAFGSPVPASPSGPTTEEVATSPATPVPPVSPPAVPAGSFGGPLSAATGAWSLWEGASEFDFDVPALPSGADTNVS